LGARPQSRRRLRVGLIAPAWRHELSTKRREEADEDEARRPRVCASPSAAMRPSLGTDKPMSVRGVCARRRGVGWGLAGS